MRFPEGRLWAACALFALSLAGVAALLLTTRWGTGLSPDSVTYVRLARNLLAGQGYASTHFPPLFPAVLAGFGWFGADPLDTARWLNVLLFGANALLLGAMLFRFAHHSAWISICGAVAVLTSSTLIGIHVMAWSEPMFLFLGFAGLFLLIEHLERPRWKLLLGSAGAVSLAFLARYVGVALVGAGALSILIFSRKSIYRRAADAVVFGAVSCLPMALWVLRNMAASGSATSRKWAVHPITQQHWQGALSNASSWFLPGLSRLGADWRRMAEAGILILVAAFAVWAFMVSRRTAGSATGLRPAGPLACFACVYFALLVVSVSFFDAHTHFDARILSPVHVCAVCVFLLLADRLLASVRNKRWWVAVAGLVFAVFAGLSLLVAGQRVYGGYTSGGRGFASKAWKSSATLRRVEALPEGSTIFTNGPDPIYILAGRPSTMVPKKINAHTKQPNRAFPEQLARVRRKLEEDRGFVVYFPAIRRGYLPSEQELVERLSLQVLMREADGTIYQFAGTPDGTSTP